MHIKYDIVNMKRAICFDKNNFLDDISVLHPIRPPLHKKNTILFLIYYLVSAEKTKLPKTSRKGRRWSFYLTCEDIVKLEKYEGSTIVMIGLLFALLDKDYSRICHNHNHWFIKVITYNTFYLHIFKHNTFFKKSRVLRYRLDVPLLKFCCSPSMNSLG